MENNEPYKNVSTTGTTTPVYDARNCLSRLPCGLCLITNSMCPLMKTYISPSWEVTCQSGSEYNVESTWSK